MEYMLAILVAPYKAGDSFQLWPLHITLVPWFKVSDVGSLKRQLKSLLAARPAFQVQVGEAQRWRSRSVYIINASTELLKLHNRLLAVTAEHVVQPTKFKFVGPHFKPHITLNKSGKLKANQTLAVDRVYLIETKAEASRFDRQKIVSNCFKLLS